MIQRSTLWSCVLGALCGCLFIGNAGCKPKAPEQTTIVVIPKGTSHEYWKFVEAGALQAGDDLKVKVLYRGTLNEDDHSGQIGKVTEAIGDRVSGIVLAPQEADAMVRPVQQATAAGVPVVVFDSALNATPGVDYVTLVATDNEKAGAMGGDELGRLLKDKKDAKVVLLRYEHGSASTDAREAGFLEAIAKYPNITVIEKDREGHSTAISAKTESMNLLDKLKDCDGIFCPNESTANGMLMALEESGLAKSKKFVGFDQSEPLIDGLKKGEIDALVAQNPHKMGYEAVKAMVDHLNGKAVPVLIDTGARLITRDNLNDPDIQQLLKP